MKKIDLLFFFLALLLCQAALVAQEDIPDESLVPPPLIQASTGLGLQLFYPFFKTTHFSLEKPLGPYRQIGVLANIVLKDYPIYDYDSGIGANSFEGGVFFKYFFRGRLSARRSPFYIGADVRAGKRTYFENQNFFGSSIEYREMATTNLKCMLLTGIQYRIGPAFLEFSMPIGVERTKTSDPTIRFGSYFFDEALGVQPVILPSISMGYAFYKPIKTKKHHRKH